MRLLLDTHVLLGLTPIGRPNLEKRIAAIVNSTDHSCFASAVGLWEIAIKARLRKLDPGMPLSSLGNYFGAMGIGLLPIGAEHVLTDLRSEPATRDPFDRLLLAICQVEGLRLVTLDRALASNALAWR
jgi:PIN domain nuclease of toxin-antitoxin system